MPLAFGIGQPIDWLIIFVVALLVFGPQKLPEVGRQLGQALREFRKMADEVTGAVQSVRDEVAGAAQSVRGEMAGAAQSVRGEIDSAAAMSERRAAKAASPGVYDQEPAPPQPSGNSLRLSTDVSVGDPPGDAGVTRDALNGAAQPVGLEETARDGLARGGLSLSTLPPAGQSPGASGPSVGQSAGTSQSSQKGE